MAAVEANARVVHGQTDAHRNLSASLEIIM